jgi:hypothetical protein
VRGISISAAYHHGVPAEAFLIAVQTAAAWWMAGLCWLVQLVVYPQFARVEAAGFAVYHKHHVTWTGAVVLPAMLIELLCGGLWLWVRPDSTAAWAGAGLLAVCWATTLACELPLHGRLKRGVTPRLVRLLVWGNLPRTLAWTARGVLLLAATGR